jgi:hypothetical protein
MTPSSDRLRLRHLLGERAVYRYDEPSLELAEMGRP